MAQATIETTVTGLQGVPVGATPPVVGQALVFNGTSWVASSSINGPLSISGNLTVSNITGPVSVAGALSATGTITGATVNAGNAGFSSSLSVPGSASLADVNINGMLTITFPAGIVPASDNQVNIGGGGNSFAAITGYYFRTPQGSPANGAMQIGPYVGTWGTSINAIIVGASGILAPATDGAINNGFGGQAWGGVFAYSFQQQSDPRSKKDVSAAPGGALAMIQKVPVHRFHFKNDDVKTPMHRGLMADELQKAVGYGERVVHVGEDTEKTLMIDQGDQIAWIWQAIQELAAEVASLKGAKA